MANDAAWEAGVRIGSERAREHRARKQALSDAQFQEKHNEIQGMIENLQTKLSYVPESDRNTPDYLKLKDQYAQAIQDRDEHWKSLDHPSEVLKFGKMLGRDLHFSKKESPVAPPVYGQPTMEVNGEKVPTGPAYKVQGPQTPAQLKAQKEANQLEAAAPLSPEQVAIQKANTEAASDLTAIQGKMKNLRTLFPDAPKEQVDKWGMELVQSVMQLKPPNEKYFTQLATTKDADGNEHYWRVPMSADEKPQEVDFNGQTMVPKTAKTAKGLKYDASTGMVVDQDTAKRYSLSDVGKSDTPPEVLEMFNGAKAMMDKKQKDALALANARGASFAQNRIVTPIDPNNPTQEIYVPAGVAAREHMRAPGSIDYKLSMPTASERQRGDFAISAHDQLKDMIHILKSRPDLFGPASGRYTDFTQWIGSQDPDAQRFKMGAQVLSDHAMAVFGGRSQYASESIMDMAGRFSTNPLAIAAGLEQLDKGLEVIGGRGSGPITPGSGAAALGTGGNNHAKPSKGRSLSAAMSLPINKGKTAQEVEKHLTDLGYTVTRP